MWLEDYHFDGLRIDAVHAIVDTSAIHFLEALAGEVCALEAHLGRHLVVIAESDLNDPRVVRAPEIGGYGLDAQWNEDFHHALHAALTGESGGYYEDFGAVADLAAALTRGLVYDGRYSRYRGRSHGRPATDLPGSRFVGCLQNHDQVGNRATGERSAQLLSTGLLKVGAALVLTAPFVPLLFQGEEWARIRHFCTSPTTRIPTSPRRYARVGAVSSPPAAGTRHAFRIRRRRRRSGAPASIGISRRVSRTRVCCAGTGS
ncbi:MAG: hypothetical protein U5K56_00195 [Halioglobus sp.]|nr:hypothetical protein [Halioglobus sp.]